MSRQDWRQFLTELEATTPQDVLRVEEEVSPEYQATAFTEALERSGRSPVVMFERVGGSPFPVLTNLLGSRERMALALGVNKSRLIAEYTQRFAGPIPEKLVSACPAQKNVYSGAQVGPALENLPFLTHYASDPAPYLTASLIVSADPDTGMSSIGYHRMMYKGGNRFGISLHSRKRLWDYQRRAEERGRNLPVACVLGVHPLISLSSLGVIPREVGKYEIAGGLFGEPLEVAEGMEVPLRIPAYAEIVIEGEILAGEREPEGPFGEFTNYSSYRSTENVFVAKAMYHRDGAMYQSICPGRSAEHCGIMAIPREADLLRLLSSTVPGIKSVHVPISGCGLLHAYISMHKTAAGQGKQAILTALGVDHCLKLVVVVDSDVDIFNDSDVLWALSTRFQADRDLVVAPGAMGVVLDPSADDQGRSARMGMDATEPLQKKAEKIMVPDEAKFFAADILNWVISKNQA